jgi:hypothetical protein
MGTRTGSELRYYRNKIKIGENLSVLNNGIPNLSIFSLCRNKSGNPSDFSNRQLSMVYVSKYLTQTAIDVLTDAFEAYMDSYGKGVIS